MLPGTVNTREEAIGSIRMVGTFAVIDTALGRHADRLLVYFVLQQAGGSVDKPA
jgi:hypothetical protein